MNRQWIDKRLRAIYLANHSPAPAPWSDIIDVWMATCGNIGQERVDYLIDQILAGPRGFRALTPDYVRRLNQPVQEDTRVAEVVEAVCAVSGVTQKELMSGRRERRLSWPRMVGYLVTRDATGKSYPEIARAFGDRDPTTIIRGVQRVERLCKTDPFVGGMIRDVHAQLQVGAH